MNITNISIPINFEQTKTECKIDLPENAEILPQSYKVVYDRGAPYLKLCAVYDYRNRSLKTGGGKIVILKNDASFNGFVNVKQYVFTHYHGNDVYNFFFIKK